MAVGISYLSNFQKNYNPVAKVIVPAMSDYGSRYILLCGGIHSITPNRITIFAFSFHSSLAKPLLCDIASREKN